MKGPTVYIDEPGMGFQRVDISEKLILYIMGAIHRQGPVYAIIPDHSGYAQAVRQTLGVCLFHDGAIAGDHRYSTVKAVAWRIVRFDPDTPDIRVKEAARLQQYLKFIVIIHVFIQD